MPLYKSTKIVLSVSNNPTGFLSGIASNTLDQPRGAFLDLHGKIIATFDQVRVDDNRYLLVLEEKFFDALMGHLERYIKLSKAVVKREVYQVYFDLAGDYQCGEDEFFIAQRQGQLVLTQNNLKSGVSAEEFTLFRLKNNIPIQGVDYNNEFLLNIDETEFVSYTKGCFLGQEPVAKVHNRSKPSWKLAVKPENECSIEEKQKMTSKAHDPITGKTLGFVFMSTVLT